MNNIVAECIALKARNLGKGADFLSDALTLLVGGPWIPLCASCYCFMDPCWKSEAYRAADRVSQCSRCNYDGVDVVAVDATEWWPKGPVQEIG